MAEEGKAKRRRGQNCKGEGPETILGTARVSGVAARTNGKCNPATAKTKLRDVAQFGRALRSGRRGRRFKSCHLDQNLPVLLDEGDFLWQDLNLEKKVEICYVGSADRHESMLRGLYEDKNQKNGILQG